VDAVAGAFPGLLGGFDSNAAILDSNTAILDSKVRFLSPKYIIMGFISSEVIMWLFLKISSIRPFIFILVRFF
jgi:hypothetical protein